MDSIRNKLVFCLIAVALAVAVSGCPQKSPEARVLEARSQYSLEPSGVLVNELETEEAAGEEGEPGEAVAVAAEASAVAAEAAAAEEAAEGEMLEEELAAPPGPRSVEVIFDLLVRYNAAGDALPGITVEVQHKDPFGAEKGKHLTWADTAGLRKGEERQVPVRLEVDNYEDGDQFSVEWNAFVPAEERGEYREFTEAAP